VLETELNQQLQNWLEKASNAKHVKQNLKAIISP
jgi:hypothetical protein